MRTKTIKIGVMSYENFKKYVHEAMFQIWHVVFRQG